jgi:hypothetical protein
VAIEIAAGAAIVAVVAVLGVTPPAHVDTGTTDAHRHSH